MEEQKKKILIIVDMQNDFVYGDLGSDNAKAIIPEIYKSIADNDLIYFTMDNHEDNYLETNEGKHLPVKHCIIGTTGAELVKPLKNLGGTFCYKNTFGFNNWREILPKESLIESIELCGVCTDICVVSNALLLKGIFPNTEIIVNARKCAGTSMENHKSALNTMRSCQITVVENED